MLLLLAGATDTARQMLASAFLAEHPSWKHLALEDIFDCEQNQQEIDEFQLTFNTIVACECVRDAQKAERCPVLITCPSPVMLATVKNEFDDKLTCVRLGADEEWDEHDFDHEVDAKRCSIKNIAGFLRKIAKA